MSMYKKTHYDHCCSECGRRIEDGEHYWDNECGHVLCEDCADKEKEE